jgi:ACT domain-containing protein
MANQRFFIIYGTGNDTVGLVKSITIPIARINGNIVDLRQDVMHGLFTIYLVVDLSQSSVSIEEFKSIVNAIGEETNLTLYVDKYNPVPRDPEKRNILLVLVGSDKPGIAAAISETLSKYKINIEFSQMIARENIFLMELLIDISHCTLPLANLQKILTESMQAMNITALIQTEDVFNKKKRILVFYLTKSFISVPTQSEVLSQTGIPSKELKKCYPRQNIKESLKAAYNRLDGLPFQVLENIISSCLIAAGTIELLQTLKIMGYKIALTSPAFSAFLDFLKTKLAIDYCFGLPLNINDDTRTISKEFNMEALGLPREQELKSILSQREKVPPEDITIISDKDFMLEGTPGIHVEFDLKLILDYYNQHILSKDNIIGLLGGFGPARLGGS